jgi:hypothetical protein
MSVHLYTSSHFPLTAYRTYISHLGHSHITLSDRACLDLLDPWGQELLLLSGYGKDGHPHGVVPEVSQEAVDEMIGNRHRPLTHHFFKNKFRTLGFIKYNESLQINTSLCLTISSSKSAVRADNLVRTELHACDNCRRRPSPRNV